MKCAFLLPATAGFLSGFISAAPALEVPVVPSRENAWTPAESLAAIEIDGPWQVRLVAAEPLIRDPVDICWDASGRCFVAEMIDYPLGREPGKPPLSRIQHLIDKDGDGSYDQAVIFAAQLDHVQGILPYLDGLIATTRTQILWLRDTDHDGRADLTTPLIGGFNPGQSQLQVSSPRWGPDNQVYFNNGLDTAEIYPSADPASKQNLARHNLRWNPRTGQLTPASGYGQFGSCFDDWGRHYSCSNRNPVMLAVLPFEAGLRIPHAGISEDWENVAPSGAGSRIYPFQATHTTADAHSGTHTSACGLTVYRGSLLPELRGEIFVCDPTGQLIVRYHPEPAGTLSRKADRVGERTDFFRSRDEWCRPVNLTTGPDGALYICDIYRRYIDHSMYFPDDFVKAHDMRQGETEGRIWRLVPKDATSAPAMPAIPQSDAGWITWLGHENAWQRETAQRVLLEKKIKPETLFAALKASKNPFFHLHATAVLRGLGSRLKLPVPAQLTAWFPDFHMALPLTAEFQDERAARSLNKNADGMPVGENDLTSSSWQIRASLLAAYPGDSWLLKIILACSSQTSGRVLTGLFKSGKVPPSHSREWAGIIHALAASSAGNAAGSDVAAMLDLLERHVPGELIWWKSPFIAGFAHGLQQSRGALGPASLTDWLAKPGPAHLRAAAEISILIDKAGQLLPDTAAPEMDREACLPLLSLRPWPDAEKILRKMLSGSQPLALQDAAFAQLANYSVTDTAPLLYELLPAMRPGARRATVSQLSTGATALDFLQRIQRQEISASLLDAETRWRYLNTGSEEQKQLARNVLGSLNADRDAVIAAYRHAMPATGDPERGKTIFLSACLGCHRLNGQGIELGPDISDVRVKLKEALLTDILDPGRMVEARWSAYQLETSENEILVGILEAESENSITLRLPGGLRKIIAQRDIRQLRNLDQSLMPTGLEAAINPDQMADLFAFLRQAGP